MPAWCRSMSARTRPSCLRRRQGAAGAPRRTPRPVARPGQAGRSGTVSAPWRVPQSEGQLSFQIPPPSNPKFNCPSFCGALLYWLPRCVRHVRTSRCRRRATCSRRCASRRPVDVRRGIRPLLRRSLIGRNDWGLRLRGRRQPLSAAAVKSDRAEWQTGDCEGKGSGNRG